MDNIQTVGKGDSRFEIIIVTLSNGHIIPVKLDRQTGETWQGHLVGGNLSWREIEVSDDGGNSSQFGRRSDGYR